MTFDKKGVCKHILNHYGLTSQIGILQEECAELIQAISKFKRANNDTYIDTKQCLAEEIADVEIMLTQIKIAFGKSFEKEVDKNINYKLERQLDRIQKEMKSNDR